VINEESVEKIEITADDGARAEVYSHGAHVTSWRPASGEERLFLSAQSAFEPDAAIRGGIPVIFPQFASMGPLPKHGFARVSDWDLVRDGRTSDGKGEAQLSLTSSARTRELWPHEFDATIIVAVGGMSLTVALSVLNPGPEPLSFTGALHTYLLVDDVREVAISGLADTGYRDSASGNAEGRQDEAPLRPRGELDRIYFEVQRPIEVRDRVRKTRITTTGFPDAVLWNPGGERASTLGDLEAGGWLRMLCVEAAVIGKAVTLAPGERWTGQQRLLAL
jgi:glucose-6-phosphate 1-epimerase